MTAEEIVRSLHESFGTRASVRARQPGRLFQVEIAAYLADGDAAQVYVKPLEDGRIQVTDLGATCMRISYEHKLSAKTDAVVRSVAEQYGFEFTNGQVTRTLPLSGLLTAAHALAQIESSAEAAVEESVAHRLTTTHFKAIVREALREAFAAAATFDHRDPEDDDGLYQIDALIHGPRKVAVAIVSSNLSAEHAVATHLTVDAAMRARGERFTWATIPRDLDALGDPYRRRLVKHYDVVAPVYDEASLPVARRKLAELARLPN